MPFVGRDRLVGLLALELLGHCEAHQLGLRGLQGRLCLRARRRCEPRNDPGRRR
jgi:hypothetical protein